MNRKKSFELLCVIFLLLILGFFILHLSIGAGGLFEKFETKKNNQDDIRIASGYVFARIKQSDKLDNIEALSDKLMIYDTEEFVTYLFIDKTTPAPTLKEITIRKNAKIDPSYGFEIAQIDSFKVTKVDDLLVCDFEKAGEKFTLNISLMSGKNLKVEE